MNDFGTERRERERLLYFVSEDWYFISHRLPVALRALLDGYDVHLVTNLGAKKDAISGLGIATHDLNVHRASLNPLQDAKALWKVARLLQNLQPVLVHNVSMKPVLYGSVAAALTRTPATVNLLPGLGYMFSSDDRVARRLRMLVAPVLRAVLNRRRSLTIVQNPDDQKQLICMGVREDRIRIVRGSGVDVSEYFPVSHAKQGCVPVIALAARLTAEKGVYDFVAASKIAKEEGLEGRFVLIGEPDTYNPSSVPVENIKRWADRGFIEWWGWREMAEAWQEVDIACLPSTYGEGLPKSLLEAASCGIPVITTDSPGCREAVDPDVTGLLIPPGDPSSLFTAIRKLCKDEELRRRMGSAGRRRIEEQFSAKVVAEMTSALYRELLD